ncbi:MAG: LTA synthase family protein [Lachnospiraceae bacterium]|nr:LTA synthase family protein [Lachnospiraceae bacterium]
MKLKMNITKKNLMIAAIMTAAAVAACAVSGSSVWSMAVFAIFCLAVINLDVEVDENYSGLISAAAIGMGSIFTTWLVQYLLLDAELRGKLSDQKFFLNICCSFVVYLALQAIVNQAGIACLAAHVLLTVFAGVNYFVYEFRGNELIYGDVKSVGTGLSVASNYRFSFNGRVMNVILASVLFGMAVWKLQAKCKRAFLMRAVCVSLAVLAVVYVADKTEKTVTETWEQKGSYQNGYLLNFVLSIRDSFVEKPKTYSKEAVAKLEEEFQASAVSGDSGKKPAIIVIMNESFADFDVLGELETNQPVTPFLDSLQENTVKGYALASVFGAKTPNSEWEFLTGNSMAYLPAGSVAYQQYVEEENAYSILDTLKKEAYTCVAMHPYYATGWSRDAVYPRFGFDEMYFLEDFDQSNLMRKYVSDATMYEKIIRRYEARKGEENLFLLGVTMQNHGGYRDRYDNFNTDVYGTKIRYSDVNQYLSLAHQSDLAIQKLVEYFSGADEPVVLCFFGDHQPSLNSSFYRKLNGKGMSGLTIDELERFYQIPFFIWTNYESGSGDVELTSINFLSTMLLDRAGIALPPYQRFLADLMEVVPAMNARAYYSKSEGRFLHYGEGAVEEEVWLERYRVLQYNGLFDRKNQSKVFFDKN